MSKGNPEWQLKVLLATVGEANLYLRDTSRRIEEHVRFYLTVATALLGAMAYAFAASIPPLLARMILALGTFALFVLGVVTFFRLMSIKTQATQHTAWQKGIEYSLYHLAFGEHPLVQRPEAPSSPSGPFSRFVIMILFVFGLFNSLMLWLSVSLTATLVLELLGYSLFPGTMSFVTSVLAYALLGFPLFVVFAIIHRQQLDNGWKKAFADYSKILNVTIWLPTESNH